MCDWTHLPNEAAGDTGSMSILRCNNFFLLLDKTVSFLLRDYFQHCSNSQWGLLWVAVQQWLTDVFLGDSEERKGAAGGEVVVVVGGISPVFSNRCADIRKNTEYCRASKWQLSNSALRCNHSIDQRDYESVLSDLVVEKGHKSYKQDNEWSS